MTSLILSKMAHHLLNAFHAGRNYAELKSLKPKWCSYADQIQEYIRQAFPEDRTYRDYGIPCSVDSCGRSNF